MAGDLNRKASFLIFINKKPEILYNFLYFGFFVPFILIFSSFDEISIVVDVKTGDRFVDLRDLVINCLFKALMFPGANFLSQVFVATLHEDEEAFRGFFTESAWWHLFSFRLLRLMEFILVCHL